jgi:hypothetical protein
MAKQKSKRGGRRGTITTNKLQGKPEYIRSLSDGIKEELRSIIRQWDKLCRPLQCSEIREPLPVGHPHYRIEGAQSHEELTDLMLRYAGSVWQLKDHLKLWVQAKGLELRDTSEDGSPQITSIEESANKSLNLMLCADLNNTKKHGTLNHPRTPYAPVLKGVSFDTSKSGVIGIYYDGDGSKTGDILASNPHSVPYRTEITSGDGTTSFGNALVIITRGFGYWIPVIRQIGILNDKEDSQWISENLCRIEGYIKQTSPFKPNQIATIVDTK